MSGMDLRHLIGNDAIRTSSTHPRIIRNEYPVVHGMVVNWEHVERIWDVSLRFELGSYCCAEEQPLMLIESPLSNSRYREKTTQIAFENLCFPGLFLCPSTTSALVATGRSSGLVIESGWNQTLKLGGKDIDYYLHDNAEFRSDTDPEMEGYRLVNQAQKEWILEKKIKQDMCFVTEDYEEELIKEDAIGPSDVGGSSVTIEENDFFEHLGRLEFPDGHKLEVGLKKSAARFLAPEILFHPSLSGSKKRGLVEIVADCLQECDPGVWDSSKLSIVLAGGSTMFRGMKERIQRDVSTTCLRMKNGTERRGIEEVEIDAPDNRDVLAWVGGSVLGSLESFSRRWITRDEFDEAGESIVHRKCY